MTDEARHTFANGTVRLRALLDADGVVKHVLVVKPMGYGLTERALNAARRLKFKPAARDGRPVAQWVTVEYNFNVF
jgi:TonB family protein